MTDLEEMPEERPSPSAAPQAGGENERAQVGPSPIVPSAAVLQTWRSAIHDARGEISRLCAGPRRGGREWTMCVPARSDDSDLVLATGLTAGESAITTVQHLTAEVARLREENERLHAGITDAVEALREPPSLFPRTDGEVRVWSLARPEWPLGACWMPNGSASPSAAVVSLSSVLEPAASIPQRYYLSPKACAGILRRAEKRGKVLPPALREALERVADGTR